MDILQKAAKRSPDSVVDILVLHETVIVQIHLHKGQNEVKIMPYNRHIYFNITKHVTTLREAIPNATRHVGIMLSHCYHWFCYCRNNVLPWSIWTRHSWDAILVNGCNIATIEVAYELMDCTRYIMFHQDSVSARGCTVVSDLLDQFLATPNLYSGLQALCRQFINVYDTRIPESFNSITLLDSNLLKPFFEAWMQQKTTVQQMLLAAKAKFTDYCDGWLPVCNKEEATMRDTDLCSPEYCDNSLDIREVLQEAGQHELDNLLARAMFFLRTKRDPSFSAKPQGIGHIAYVNQALDSDRGPYYYALKYFQDFYGKRQ